MSSYRRASCDLTVPHQLMPLETSVSSLLLASSGLLFGLYILTILALVLWQKVRRR